MRACLRVCGWGGPGVEGEDVASKQTACMGMRVHPWDPCAILHGSYASLPFVVVYGMWPCDILHDYGQTFLSAVVQQHVVSLCIQKLK